MTFLFFQSGLPVNCHQPAWTQSSSSFSSVFIFQLSDLFSQCNLAMTSDSFNSACVSSPVTRKDNPQITGNVREVVTPSSLIKCWAILILHKYNVFTKALSSNYLHSFFFCPQMLLYQVSFFRKKLLEIMHVRKKCAYSLLL